MNIRILAEKIAAVGFECIRCGTCCTRVEEDSNLVMVMPDEIRMIMEYTGEPWDAIAEPYPDGIRTGLGQAYTIGWCIRRDNNRCSFLKDGACMIYPVRPWICRTYPFMLDVDELVVFPCLGIGRDITRDDAQAIAADLIKRNEAEVKEEMSVKSVLKCSCIPAGDFYVVDNEGLKTCRQQKRVKLYPQIPNAADSCVSPELPNQHNGKKCQRILIGSSLKKRL
jgi:Fe-S-cluster containining protein